MIFILCFKPLFSGVGCRGQENRLEGMGIMKSCTGLYQVQPKDCNTVCRKKNRCHEMPILGNVVHAMSYENKFERLKPVPVTLVYAPKYLTM